MRKPDRVYLLDELRGLAVLLMIFYHGAYDAVYLFRFTGTAWFTSAPMAFLQRYIAMSFILIAGIMGRYTGSNLRRGAKTFLCGMLVTAVTLLVLPSERILFGILHFLGAAMMLLGLCEPLLKKIPASVGLLLSALLYLATDSIGRGWIGLGRCGWNCPGRSTMRVFSFRWDFTHGSSPRRTTIRCCPGCSCSWQATGWERPSTTGGCRTSATGNTCRRWAGWGGMPCRSIWHISLWCTVYCG